MDTSLSRNAEPVRQFSVFLINRAGALLSVVRLLEDSMVHVLALSIHDSVDVTVARMVVSDPDTVETLFMEKGIPFGTCDLLAVELPMGPDDLSKCLRAFLEAEINIHFAYPLLAIPNSKSVLVAHLEDRELGETVMRQHGYRTLRQAELSR
jgi:hypothetical protein